MQLFVKVIKFYSLFKRVKNIFEVIIIWNKIVILFPNLTKQNM